MEVVTRGPHSLGFASDAKDVVPGCCSHHPLSWPGRALPPTPTPCPSSAALPTMAGISFLALSTGLCGLLS